MVRRLGKRLGRRGREVGKRREGGGGRRVGVRVAEGGGGWAGKEDEASSKYMYYINYYHVYYITRHTY